MPVKRFSKYAEYALFCPRHAAVCGKKFQATVLTIQGSYWTIFPVACWIEQCLLLSFLRVTDGRAYRISFLAIHCEWFIELFSLLIWRKKTPTKLHKRDWLINQCLTCYVMNLSIIVDILFYDDGNLTEGYVSCARRSRIPSPLSISFK